MLITASELHVRLHASAMVVCDCRHDLVDHARGGRSYAEAHIPCAHFAAIETDLSGSKNGANGRHPLPDPRAFAAFLAARGVGPTTTIVAYDDSGGAYAIRLWWLARWIGHENVAVLDGGWSAWLAHKFPTTRDVPALAASPMAYPVRPGAMPTTNADELLANISNPRLAVFDARAPERYRGEQEPIDPVAGHIPGARNRFHKANLQADLTFRPPEELKSEFLALLRGRTPTEVVHYCGSGITGAVNLFAMELAGLKGSRLYPGSWSEWCADRRRPVATRSDEPALRRGPAKEGDEFQI
jgi:thiosulfate/3-mercaptopyruvate sulfurtransferase